MGTDANKAGALKSTCARRLCTVEHTCVWWLSRTGRLLKARAQAKECWWQQHCVRTVYVCQCAGFGGRFERGVDSLKIADAQLISCSLSCPAEIYKFIWSISKLICGFVIVFRNPDWQRKKTVCWHDMSTFDYIIYWPWIAIPQVNVRFVHRFYSGQFSPQKQCFHTNGFLQFTVSVKAEVWSGCSIRPASESFSR